MAALILNGEPGTVITNTTGKVLYQFIVNWHNSCGVCAQYDHAVGPSWPIPLHVNCRCKQLFIGPGDRSQPFVDFREKVAELPAHQQARVVGASNYKLVEAGLAEWSDVVTTGRVRTFREVVANKGLSVKALVKAGVRKGVAEDAFGSVHTAAHAAAEESRRRLTSALRAKGLSNEQIKRMVGERLAGRVTIGGGSGPTAPPKQPTPTPLTPAQIESTLGVRLRPPVAAGRPIAEKLAAYTEGDRKLDLLREVAAPQKAAEDRAARLSAEIRDAVKGYVAGTHAPTDERLADLRLHYREALDAVERHRLKARAAVAEILKAKDPVRFVTGEAPEGVPAGAVKQGVGWLGSVVEKGQNRHEVPAAFRPLAKRSDGRAFYAGKGVVKLSPHDDAGVVVHELGHLLEDAVPQWGRAARAFLDQRVGGEKLTPLREMFGDSYEPGEMGRRDRFADAFGDAAWYVGKHYDDATEVTAMGLEKLFRDPSALIRRDPEFAKFLLGLLDGSLR